MFRHHLLWLVTILFIGSSPGLCEEVAFAFVEDGSRPLSYSHISEYNGSEIITFTVASGPDGRGLTSKSTRTVASIKSEVDEKVEVGNADVRGEALRLVRKYPGSYNIDQICSIYEDLCENWYYASDPRGIEYFQYANQTLNYEKAGDCDDFAILMSALIENVGGSTRIILAYGPSGHAYTEVYLGKVGDEDQRVERIIARLKDRYDVAEVNTHKDLKTDEVWLNLDWGDDPRKGSYPGGPFYTAQNHVVLQVRDEYDKSPVNPPNEPPLAIVSYEPEEPSAGENVTFNASKSHDTYGTIIGYEWDFGSGKTAEGRSVEYNYSEGGVFTVNLTVFDDEGAEGFNSTEIRINKPPVAQFGYLIEKIGSDYKITFDASESYDEKDGAIATYLWDFGDGQITMELPYLIRTSHLYLNSGTYNVSLTVKDNKGAKGIKSIPIKINEPPIAKIYIDKSEANMGDEVAFNASESNDSDGSITEYRWDFGDGYREEARSVSHNYSTYGNFTVKLEVKDDDNATNSTESEIYVNKPPVASFTYTPTIPLVGDAITFNASESEDEDGEIVAFRWDFSDIVPQFKSVSATRQPLWGPDNFTVTLTVTDDDSAITSSTTLVTVREKTPPVIKYFKANPEEIKPSEICNLSWSVSDAISVAIDPGVGTVEPTGSIDVSPEETTTYTLEASNSAGSTQRTVQVAVEPESYDGPFTPTTVDRVEIRSTVSRVIDGATYMYDPQDFTGFYYDIDDDIGTEKITMTITGNALDEPDGAKYTTTAQKAYFNFHEWGEYWTIGFMAEEYFAAYVDGGYLYDDSINKNLMVGKQLSRVLMDDDNDMTFTSGSPLKLKEGYELAIQAIDLDGNKVYVQLMKDGQTVNSAVVKPSMEGATLTDKTYTYKKNLGDTEEIVIVAVHFKNAFRGADQDLATVDGIWQISDTYTDVEKGTEYDKMTIQSVDGDAMSIVMNNKDNKITLSKNKDLLLMENVRIKTADQDFTAEDPLRFYIYKEITEPGTYEIRGPVNTVVDGAVVGWDASTFAGFYYDIDEDLGTEKLTMTITGNALERPNGVRYETVAQASDFGFEEWGKYFTIGFLADEYFAAYDEAGYLAVKSGGDNLIVDKQLSRVLMDDDSSRTFTSGTPLKLAEDYELAIQAIDIDGNKVYVQLMKDGQTVNSAVVEPSKDGATLADKTYTYKKNLGDTEDVVIVAVHFKNAFRGADQDLATVDGIWQISDTYTDVEEDTEYDKMIIQSVDSDAMSIVMDSKEITLNKNKDQLLMESIRIKTADSNDVPNRFYIYEEVTIGPRR